MLNLVQADQLRSKPWKNGGGSTTELACWPPGAAIDDFLWRISVASIERDGPFSSFAGVDRVLVLLDGAGMRLDFDAGARLVCCDNPRIDFAGEQAPMCSLLDGPTRDFNLMWQRGSTVNLRNIQLDGDWQHRAEAGRLHALYLLAGAAHCALGPILPGDLLWGTEIKLSAKAQLLSIDLPFA